MKIISFFSLIIFVIYSVLVLTSSLKLSSSSPNNDEENVFKSKSDEKLSKNLAKRKKMNIEDMDIALKKKNNDIALKKKNKDIALKKKNNDNDKSLLILKKNKLYVYKLKEIKTVKVKYSKSLK